VSNLAPKSQAGGGIKVPRAGFDPASPTRKASILSILTFQFDRAVRLVTLYYRGSVVAGEIWLINIFLRLPFFDLSSRKAITRSTLSILFLVIRNGLTARRNAI